MKSSLKRRLQFVMGAALPVALLPAASVTVNLSTPATPTVVEKNLFGLFQEEHWGDLVPGIWEQYIVNPSFEPWYRLTDPSDEKTREPFLGTEAAADNTGMGIAFPWEKSGSQSDGIWSLDNTSANVKNTAQSQKIQVYATKTVGVRQRIAVPHARQKSGDPDYGRYYELRFWAKRTSSISTVRVKLINADDTNVFNGNNHVVTVSTAASGDWVVQRLDLGTTIGSNGGRLGTTHRQRFGAARVSIEATADATTGGGTLWIDQVTLIPEDADGFVSGGGGYAFNPETLAYMRDVLKPTLLRWPGGNFCSTYDWRDGVGPRDARPTRPNLAWGGVTANELGTDEFLEFCKRVGAKVAIGAASNGGYPTSLAGTFIGGSWTIPTGLYHITPSELADWVEYCNASSGTLASERKMNVNAINGNTDAVPPWDIELWGVGNEVYGTYQFGNDSNNVAAYMSKLEARASAMKSRPSNVPIKIIASAMGVHNEFRNAHGAIEYPPIDWTEQILGNDNLCKVGEVIAGKSLIDYLDLHHYVYGATNSEVSLATPTPAGKQHPNTARRALFGATQNLEAIYADVQSIIANPAKCRNPDIKLMHLEWAVLPKNWSAAASPLEDTFANGIATAAQLNAFLRHADLVHGGAWHNFSPNQQPVAQKSGNPAGHSYPVHPRTDIFALYRSRAAEKVVLNVGVSGSPTYDVTTYGSSGQTMVLDDEIGNLTAVREIDVSAVVDGAGNTIDVFIINRSLATTHTLTVNMPFNVAIKSGTSSGTRFHASSSSGPDPYALQDWHGWNGSAFVTPTHLTSAASMTYGSISVNSLSVPPLEFVHLKLNVSAEVILDNAEANVNVGTLEYNGSWALRTTQPSYYSTNYRDNATGVGSDKMRWRPKLPLAGTYNVFYWIPEGRDDRADNASLTVHHASGSSTYTPIDQDNTAGGAWVLLGGHAFPAGTSGHVELTDDANGVVVGDAMKFTKP